MNDEQKELARRLAAHPRFEWRRGVLALFEPAPYCYGELRIEEDGWTPTWCDDIAQPNGWPDVKRVAWPDLTDAATGGVLAGMLGEGHVVMGPQNVQRGRCEGERLWIVHTYAVPGASYHLGTTLAEACARALLAEWGEA